MKTIKSASKVSGWSDELQTQTRSLILNPPLSIGPYLSMKNIDGQFGEIALTDLLTEQWKVSDKETNEITHYVSCDEIINAGWAVD